MKHFGGGAQSSTSKLRTHMRAAAAAKAHGHATAAALPHLTMSFSMRCDTTATSGGQAALDAAVEDALRGVGP